MSSYTVLIIDDEETGLHVRKLVLESEGYQVLSARNGSEGLDLFARKRVDAVITDQNMPGMDGVQLAKEIKKRKPALPVIMLSALQSPPDDAVVDAFVVKGQAPGILLDTLASHLRLHLRSHKHFDGKYVAFVDQDRRYLDVTDGVCELLGYSRSDLLRMRIDDIAAPSEVPKLAPLFEKYVAEKGLDGSFLLRDSRGKVIPIRYQSRVFPDGCMVASWQPQL